ncbi:MAG: DNA-binding protein WhiA [Tissierellia bacterium]|nr:DNA-binding protein WhiA [Tissierellia bacterium]
MSFSNDIRTEISKRKIYSDLEALIELSAILKTNASISLRNAFFNINFTTENIDVSKRIYKLIEKIYDYEPTVSFLKNDNIQKDGIYTISIEDEGVVNALLSSAGIDLYGNYTTNMKTLYQRLEDDKDHKKRAHIRGAFLGAGSMVDPEKSYHLEMIFSKDEDYVFTKKILEDLNLSPLISERKDKFVIYYKDSEKISDFLNLIGATNSMLALENVKAMKDVRNNVNRQVNCDTANINKSLSAAMKQTQQINYIKEKKGLNFLDEGLRTVAQARLDRPDLSLRDLAKAIEPELSKSGLSHRLKKIEEIYKSLVEEEN